MNIKKLTIIVMILLFLPISFAITYWGPYTIELNVWNMEPYIICDPTPPDPECCNEGNCENNYNCVCESGQICYEYDPDDNNKGACVSSEKKAGDPCNRMDQCSINMVCVEDRPGINICIDISKFRGEPCDGEEDCGAGKYCYFKQEKCLPTDGTPGSRCGEHNDCDTGIICDWEETVQRCFKSGGNIGGECNSKYECGAETICEGGFCISTPGNAGDKCDSESDCNTMSCVQGKCEGPPQSDGDNCINGKCGAGTYCDGTTCRDTSGEEDAPCDIGDNSDCSGLNCVNNKCTGDTVVDGPCNDGQCSEGQVCKEDKCVLTSGDASSDCDSISDCDSGHYCTRGKCRPTTGGGGGGDPTVTPTCTYDTDCESGFLCESGGICIETPGLPGEDCFDETDCGAGMMCPEDIEKCFRISEPDDTCTNEYSCWIKQICFDYGDGDKRCKEQEGVACDTCSFDLDCGLGMFCDTVANTCSPIVYNINAPCTQDCECNSDPTLPPNAVLSCNGAFCTNGAPVCGNTEQEIGETCDDGNTNSGDGCSSSCQTESAYCGNGLTETPNEGGQIEECDDNNNNNGDGCSSACIIETATYCGDSTIQKPNSNGQMEQCEDGNTAPGDGCSSTCQIEGPIEDTYCGDSITQAPNGIGMTETCDDGNSLDGDGCSSTCQSEGTTYCGDGTVQSLNDNNEIEQCDDNNNNNGDGCSSTCQNEDPPGITVCGDGIEQLPNDDGISEQCDDGNVLDGDGCSSTCQLETPTFCSDGTIQTPNSNGETEECDDGNAVGGDGCTSNCKIELAPICGDNDWNNAGEDCDGNDLQTPPKTCEYFGYGPGTLACYQSNYAIESLRCKFDKRLCPPPSEGSYCGDGIKDTGEACDINSDTGIIDFGIASTDCIDYSNGYTSGTIGCTGECNFDYSTCEGEKICGNNIAGDVFSEVCDCGDPIDCTNGDLSGETCESQNRGQGTLSCDNSCNFDFSGCGTVICQNNIKEGSEQCDCGTTNSCTDEGNGDLDGETCVSRGFYAGDLRCDPSTCNFNTDACTNEPAVCGDGTWTRPDEICDASDTEQYSPIPCTSHCCTGGGNVVCIPDGQPNECTWDTSLCTGCVVPDFPGDCSADCHIDFKENSDNLIYYQIGLNSYLCNAISINVNRGDADALAGCSSQIRFNTYPIDKGGAYYYADPAETYYWGGTGGACADTGTYP